MKVLDTCLWSMIMSVSMQNFISLVPVFFFNKIHQTIAKESFSQGFSDVMLCEILLF